jgi:hypothetical protein
MHRGGVTVLSSVLSVAPWLIGCISARPRLGTFFRTSDELSTRQWGLNRPLRAHFSCCLVQTQVILG